MTDPLERGQLHWGFSTLGCPELTLPEVCDLAREFNIRELEVRALFRRVDLPHYAREKKLTAVRIQELLQPFAGRIVVLGADYKLLEGGSEAARAYFSEYCDWAESLGVPYVRVFGGGVFGEPLIDAQLGEAARNVLWWRGEKKKRNWQTEILLETHDVFSASAPCEKLNDRLDEPLNIIWDTHHTWRLGGESPAESWAKMGRWVRHVHFKDSIDRPSERHPYTYVLPGTGQMPLGELFDLLHAKNFGGVASLESEKMWHPYLPGQREHLAHLQTQAWFKNSKPSPALSSLAD